MKIRRPIARLVRGGAPMALHRNLLAVDFAVVRLHRDDFLPFLGFRHSPHLLSDVRTVAVNSSAERGWVTPGKSGRAAG